jgi:hypothetical protein
MTRSWPVIVFAITFILYFPVDAFWNLHLLKKTNNILRSEFRVVMSLTAMQNLLRYDACYHCDSSLLSFNAKNLHNTKQEQILKLETCVFPNDGHLEYDNAK